MQEFIGKEVEVTTVETVYRGTLIEISENEIMLQSQSGWIAVSMNKVTDVRAVDE